ncbi:hypothetical protein FRC02_007246 [Tulasnella sp. 418]|nr:hypothetical protein FRC02_007246 [Tulasnella sp. 418]
MTIHSLLSSIKANPICVVIVFSQNLVNQCDAILETTLLAPGTHPILSKFYSLPETIRTTDGKSGGSLHCGFQHSPVQSLIYHELLPFSAYANITTLKISLNVADVGGDACLREAFEEFGELEEIHFHSYFVGSWTILAPLSSPVSSNLDPSSRRWLCPKLKTLYFEGAEVYMELWEFFRRNSSVVKVEVPAAKISYIEVSMNAAHDELDEVPLDTATDVANILGHDGFIYEAHYLDVTKGEWQDLPTRYNL